MEIFHGLAGCAAPVVALFRDSFTASEGAAEGRLVSELARDLMAGTPPSDLRVFRAEEAGEVIGAAIFTRLAYPQDARRVMLLSPMAVSPDRQGRGVGQDLLRHALAALRAEGTEVVLTYGDPDFYGRVGFAGVDQGRMAAPHALGMPQGWLGQSLSGGEMPALSGVPVCAAALDRAEFW